MCKKILCFVVTAMLAIAGSTVVGDVITGLEGYWPLDDDAQDFSGNDHHGTVIGDPQFVVDGVFGGALEFDGDDFVSMDGYKGIMAAVAQNEIKCIVVNSGAGAQHFVAVSQFGGVKRYMNVRIALTV